MVPVFEAGTRVDSSKGCWIHPLRLVSGQGPECANRRCECVKLKTRCVRSQNQASKCWFYEYKEYYDILLNMNESREKFLEKIYEFEFHEARGTSL